MFSGIVEQLGTITKLTKEGSNLHLEVEVKDTSEMYIDQSISHNGVCLTLVNITANKYVVTAIEETLMLTNLGKLKEGDEVNLERSMTSEMRLDGHLVQGHVDTKAVVVSIEEKEGSWYFEFEYDSSFSHLIVSKGSICVNGVSLTVVEPSDNRFKVAIIPYTYEHTNFHAFLKGDEVNLEFDIIGKYVAKQMAAYKQ